MKQKLRRSHGTRTHCIWGFRSSHNCVMWFGGYLMVTGNHKVLNRSWTCFQPPLWGRCAQHGLLCCVADFSVQFSSVAQLCPTLCNPMNRSTPGLPVHHHLPEFTQTHIHRVSVAIQPSHPQSSPSPPACSPSQHQSLFQWVNSSHEVAKVLEFQL